MENNKYFSFDVLNDLGFVAIQTKRSSKNMKEKENLYNIINELKLKGKVISAKQTHSTNIVCVDSNTDLSQYDEIDGYITNDKNCILVTFYADCLPIFLLDKKNNVISLLHAGWRGSVNKILEKGIELMQEKYNSKLDDIIVNFGIGISCKNYEIKQDTVDIIKSLLDFDNMLVYKDGKIYLDNMKLNEQLALNIGIKKENIYKNNLCTYDDDYFSYRKDKDDNRSAAIFAF